MNRPSAHPILLLQGTDQVIPLTIQTDGGAAVDFTGWTGFACHLRRERNGNVAGAPLAELTVVVDNATQGKLSLHVDAATSAAVNVEHAVGDIVALDPQGNRHRVVNLDVTVDFQVTTA